jgi:hypothetical protein
MSVKSQNAESLERRLEALGDHDLAELRRQWEGLTRTLAPKISRDLLILALGHQLQVQAYGGLPPALKQQLVDDEGGACRKVMAVMALRPGTRLVREWNGVSHVVRVEGEGRFVWRDQNWSSLSRIAREITGTRWSGPAFFGLRDNNAVAASDARPMVEEVAS